MSDDTLPGRPGGLGNRPKTGLAAWEATVGYIAAEHSPDALLTMRAHPDGEATIWAAMLEWGQKREMVDGRETLPLALRDLWRVVDQAHVIFMKNADAIRRPAGYGDLDWLDADTRDALERLTWVLRVVFKTDWTLVMIYQPTDNPAVRVEMRLVARESTVHIGGRGPSVREAATQLYRNATPYLSGKN